ncbi:amidase signature domain-containing protein [Talaromyces proteolyticus]|uniref:Amidase signature domain-containing protein n=1 Tax=Talaromyces proteolyticus TaxID=1131652 RepID=A0AAD4PRQ4_9EURO|nr:amidase signature domain-containing protein [Talaromyces proteolyticus]KAH8689444.1 amidase signature domain-containing protein [Talaromyces proteolyticus]
MQFHALINTTRPHIHQKKKKKEKERKISLAQYCADMAFNVLTTNAVDLKQLIEENKFTSVQIVQEYFAQINRYESALNALISPAPRDNVLAIASALDQERQNGKVRSSFHGIPIILKDSFVTAWNLGMSTTAGSCAFVGSKASNNGAITQRLINAGLIILGKANMTEFAGMKMTTMMPGWSAHGGQTLSPYVGRLEVNEKLLGHSAPGGSSTGSAVAVAAGFSPLAMGTETVGSIVTPSTRAGLYALKPTIGIQDTTGLYTMTDFFDSSGPMAKSAADVRMVAEILLGRSFDFSQLGLWEGLSVGFLDPRVWNMSSDFCTQFAGTAEQMVEDYEETVFTLQNHGCPVRYPVDLKDVSALPVTILPIAYWDFKNVCIPRFIDAFDECPVRSVADIVRFNQKNSERALPAPFTEQNDLEGAMNSNEERERIDVLKKELRNTAQRLLQESFDRERINILVAPGDSSVCVHAAAAGYPIATVPIAQLRYNNRPFGLCLVARANEEETLLRFMNAYEKIAKPRPVPKFHFLTSESI